MAKIQQTEKIEVYKPEFIKENPSSLPETFKGYNEKLFQELKNGNGLIKVKLDNDVVIQRISHDLYANWESGIRELLNNEVRACNRAKKEFGLDSYIEITLDSANKKLIIHGVNSLGITTEIFLNVMRVLGVSDNFDSSEVGQFGFGFASYTTISDTIIVETYSAKTKERFAVSGKSGIGFDILPEPKNLKDFGTRITLIFKKNSEEIYDYIKEMASFKTVPIYLILPYALWKPKHNYEHDGEKEIIAEKGKILLNAETSLKEILKAYVIEKSKSHTYYYDHDELKLNSENYQDVFLEIEKKTDDYEFIGVISKKKVIDEISPITLLLRTPINMGYGFTELKPFYCFIVNIKNERKYNPTTDRERLKDDSVSEIRGELEKLTDNLENLIDFETWTDLIKNFDKLGFYETLLSCEEIKTRTPRHKIDMLNYLHFDFKVYEHDEIKPVNKSLKGIIENRFSYEDIYFSTVNIETQIRAVLNRCSCVILTKNAGLMEKLGFKNLKDVIGLDADFGKTKISVHTSHIGSSGWSRTESIKRTSKIMLLNEILDSFEFKRIVLFDKKISSYCSILSNILTDYAITQLKANQIKWLKANYEALRETASQKRISEPLKIISFEEWINEIGNKPYTTNKGKIKAKNLKKYCSLFLHNTDIKETAGLLVNDDWLYIAVSNSENFELRSYFTAKNIKFSNFEEIERLETLAGYCYKCGFGTDSIRTEKDYSNLAFYLKKRLDKKGESLYGLFKNLTYVFHSGTYSNERRLDVDSVKKLSDIMVFYAENFKPQLNKKLTLKNVDVENYHRLTDFTGKT